MANCLTAIAYPIDGLAMSKWRCVSDLMNVLDTQPVVNMCIERDKIIFDDMTFENIDCRLISALVLHECSGSPNDPLIQFQTPALGLVQQGPDTMLCAEGWCLTPEGCIEPAYPDTCDPNEDCCAKAKRLQCCLDLWLCGDRVSSVSMEGRTLSYSAASVKCLKDRIRELKIECAQKRNPGCPTRKTLTLRC